MYPHAGAAADALMTEIPRRELGGPSGIFAFDGERSGRRRRHDQTGPRSGGAESTKPAPGRLTQVEDAEVEAGTGLYEYSSAILHHHDGSARSEAAGDRPPWRM